MLDLVQDDGRGVQGEEAAGSPRRQPRGRRLPREKRTGWPDPKTCSSRVVFPDCRGPVSTTTGNSRAARRRVRSSERGMYRDLGAPGMSAILH